MALAFVQFPHPGAEHYFDGLVMPWNTSEHARKFLLGHGQYLEEGRLVTGPFTFWGEWEPPSKVIQTFDTSAAGHPHFLHEPFWYAATEGNNGKNTDPLVFGETFLYSNCRQEANSKLRRLSGGSVMLFGSRQGQRANEHFVLDTVMVIEDDALATGQLDRAVEHVVLAPLGGRQAHAENYRQYRGRMYSSSTSQTFSFVPCLPSDGEHRPFARPTITLDPHWLTPALASAARVTPASREDIFDLWRTVREQVLAQGLALAVRIGIPPEESAPVPRQPNVRLDLS